MAPRVPHPDFMRSWVGSIFHSSKSLIITRPLGMNPSLSLAWITWSWVESWFCLRLDSRPLRRDPSPMAQSPLLSPAFPAWMPHYHPSVMYGSDHLELSRKLISSSSRWSPPPSGSVSHGSKSPIITRLPRMDASLSPICYVLPRSPGVEPETDFILV